MSFFFASCTDFFESSEQANWMHMSENLQGLSPTIKVQQDDLFTNIIVSIKVPKNYSYPISKSGDTLNITRFYFDLDYQNRFIPLDTIFTNTLLKLEKHGKNKMAFKTAKYRLSENKKIDIKLRIPQIAFYSIPHGKQTFNVEFYQDTFWVELKKGKYEKYTVLENQFAPILNGKFNFSIDIPKVYRSKVAFKSFKLNVSKNSDFTIIDKGYADMYWTMMYSYRANYFKSKTFFNSKIYVKKEEFNYYHLKENSEIEIAVWDYDMFSRDDLQGKITLPLNEFKSDSKYKMLNFGNVKDFQIQITPSTPIN